jgi:hypothetical protein
MKAPRIYSTAGAFRKALEERLRQISTADRTDIDRLRRQISFDRFLARPWPASQLARGLPCLPPTF